MDKYRINRKGAVSLGSAIREYLQSSPMRASLGTRRIFAAWDKVSGAGKYTLRYFWRSGTLYITLSSAVVRSHLFPLRAELAEKINLELAGDELYISDGGTPVREIILK